jgi:hypothetical protein
MHPKLNMRRRPIANKYREGKMKRNLKRCLKECELGSVEGVVGWIQASCIGDSVMKRDVMEWVCALFSLIAH